MVTKLIIVRHCETKGNSAMIFQGHTDTPLSEKGIFQLGLVAARLSGEKIDKIYTSPQPRAKKTAEAINAFHNVPIVEEDGLREIFVGDMDGMDCREIPVKYPDISRDWDEAPWDFASPGGETMRQVYDRAAKAVQRIVEENPGKTLLLTSHGCLIRNLLCWCAGWPIEDMGKVPLGHNTAVSIAEIDGDKSRKLTLISDCAHHPPGSYDPKREFKLMALLNLAQKEKRE